LGSRLSLVSLSGRLLVVQLCRLAIRLLDCNLHGAGVYLPVLDLHR
jgi:hypothetical protein